MEKKEYILCASIHFDDGKKHNHQPKNIETGFVVSGRRHHNCYTTLQAIGYTLGINEDVMIKQLIDRQQRDGQGFLTNLDRHVDRSEGYLIAKSAGQLIHNMHDESNPILISEDLY
ncbi:hypothetical protein [Pedobacter sp. Hv1]|uniref:hypothetical protein n=1 Tax=Pedobacter sp. Hv1 TaxID=1740090 RepID=UPI0006D8B18A|nr:hypothetical protein [Pedobacter sp. Hv1]KQC02075.1 hypothetical protein AQF98_00440 [Pedobacter sp. Hv1]